jgi:hypothetical protein
MGVVLVEAQLAWYGLAYETEDVEDLFASAQAREKLAAVNPLAQPLDRPCLRSGFSVLSPAAGHRPRHAVSSPGSLPPIRWAARSPGLAPARCAASAEITSLRL